MTIQYVRIPVQCYDSVKLEKLENSDSAAYGPAKRMTLGRSSLLSSSFSSSGLTLGRVPNSSTTHDPISIPHIVLEVTKLTQIDSWGLRSDSSSEP